MDFHDRKVIFDSYKFTCTCPFCQTQGGQGEDVRVRKGKIMASLKNFVTKGVTLESVGRYWTILQSWKQCMKHAQSYVWSKIMEFCTKFVQVLSP